MKFNTNWYWGPEMNKQIVIVTTRTILNQCLDVSVFTDLADIPIGVCNIIRSINLILKRPILITNEDYYYVLYQIMCPDKFSLRNR